MCGRFVLISPLTVCGEDFPLDGPLPNYPPRYNIAPTQAIPVLRPLRAGVVGIALMRWGLIPRWSKGPDSRYSMINARAESVHERPAYAQAFRQRRALVPANGYYEWQAAAGGSKRGAKQPFLIAKPKMALFYMAALWDAWTPPPGHPAAGEGRPLLSVTVVTTAATAQLRPIHDRMPVIVPAAAAQDWLAPSTPSARLAEMLRGAADDFEIRPVSPTVNNAGHDAPDCIAAPLLLFSNEL